MIPIGGKVVLGSIDYLLHDLVMLQPLGFSWVDISADTTCLFTMKIALHLPGAGLKLSTRMAVYI